ncbi:hypothetical protein CPC08DRAFT_762573 [Agrocybe pediades]|nr:hypothetical protein CPC08DRAFT_762573 [Agrocybe pediades]
MSALSSLLHELFEGLKNVQSSRYAHLAAGTMVVYDQFLTFDQELNLIWRESFSIGKVLFLMIRYYALVITAYALFCIQPCQDGYRLTSLPDLTYTVDTIILRPEQLVDPENDSILSKGNHRQCNHFYKWQGWSGLAISVLTEVALQLRIYALYPENKIVISVMLLAFLASTGVSASIVARAVSNLDSVPLSTPGGLEFCLPTSIVSWYYTYFIPVLVFESFLCGLAVYKTLNMRTTSTLSVFSSGRHFLRVLFRDSVVYFLAISATHLTTMLFWLLGNVELSEIPLVFSAAFPIVIINRLILNIREMKYNSGHGSEGAAPFKNVNYLSQHGEEIIHVTRTVDVQYDSSNAA